MPRKNCGPEPAIDPLLKVRSTMSILLIILLLVLGVGAGYYGHRRWGFGRGTCFGFGTILLVLVAAYIARVLR